MDSYDDYIDLDEIDRIEKEALSRTEERRSSNDEASCRPPYNKSAGEGLGTAYSRKNQDTNNFQGSQGIQGNQMGYQSSQTGYGARSSLTVKIRPYKNGKIATESPYDPDLVKVIRGVAGHEWNRNERIWMFPEGQLQKLMEVLTNSPNLSINLAVDKELQEGSTKASQGSRSNILYTPQTSPPAGHRQSCLEISLYGVGGSDRIGAKASYHEGFKNTAKSIPNNSWDQTERAWTFPKSQFEAVAEALSNIPNTNVKLTVKEPLELPSGLKKNSQSEHFASNAGQANISEAAGGKTEFSTKICANLGSQGPSQPSSSQEHPFEGAIEDGRTSCIVKLLLHISGKLAASFSYYQPLVSKMRSISGADWDSKSRLWLFPFSAHAEVLIILKETPGVKVEDLQPLVRRSLQDVATRPDDSDLYQKIPNELEERLLPFQREGIKFALKKGGRALIADEMGLGKTLQAIAIALCYKEAWPVLVIVPSALRLHWAMAIHEWLQPEVDASDIAVVVPAATRLRQGFTIVKTSSCDQLHLDGLFCIISYEAVHKLPSSVHFKVVVADEAHYLKSGKARRTMASLPFLQKAERAILLTGTPALNRPIELHKLLESLQPTVYRSFKEYGSRYCKSAGSGQHAKFGQFRGCSNPDELHTLVKSTVMIRRLKADVLPQLPPKRRQQVLLELDPKSMHSIRAVMKELDDLQSGMDPAKDPMEQNILMNKAYMETAKAKVQAVQDYIDTLLEGDCKFLVFAHHRVLLDAVEEKVKKVGYIRIDGKTPHALRPDLVKSFQDQENVRVAVLSIQAAGVGLTLTAASTVVFAEMAWTPGVLVQAEDRAHRIGQANCVNVIYLHAPETLDDMIWETVGRKLENIGQVMDGRDCSMELEPKPHPKILSQQTTLVQCLNAQKIRQEKPVSEQENIGIYTAVTSPPEKSVSQQVDEDGIADTEEDSHESEFDSASEDNESKKESQEQNSDDASDFQEEEEFSDSEDDFQDVVAKRPRIC